MQYFENISNDLPRHRRTRVEHYRQTHQIEDLIQVYTYVLLHNFDQSFQLNEKLNSKSDFTLCHETKKRRNDARKKLYTLNVQHGPNIDITALTTSPWYRCNELSLRILNRARIEHWDSTPQREAWMVEVHPPIVVVRDSKATLLSSDLRRKISSACCCFFCFQSSTVDAAERGITCPCCCCVDSLVSLQVEIFDPETEFLH